jgi:hypothetical protein
MTGDTRTILFDDEITACRPILKKFALKFEDIVGDGPLDFELLFMSETGSWKCVSYGDIVFYKNEAVLREATSSQEANGGRNRDGRIQNILKSFAAALSSERAARERELQEALDEASRSVSTFH